MIREGNGRRRSLRPSRRASASPYSQIIGNVIWVLRVVEVLNPDVLSPKEARNWLFRAFSTKIASFTSTYGTFTQRLQGQDVGQTFARLDPWPARLLHSRRVGALQRPAAIENFTKDRVLTSINAMVDFHFALRMPRITIAAGCSRGGVVTVYVLTFVLSPMSIAYLYTYTVKRKWERIINGGFEKSSPTLPPPS